MQALIVRDGEDEGTFLLGSRPRPDPRLTRAHRFLHKCWSTLNSKAAHLFSKRPLVSILLGFLVLGGLSAGYIQVHKQYKAEKLWVPQHTRAMRDRDFEKDTFGKPARQEHLILTSRDGGSVLRKSILQSMCAMDSQIQTEKTHYKGEELDFGSICVKQGMSCMVQSIIEVFGDCASIEPLTDAQILEAVQKSSPLTPMESPYEYIMGGIEPSLDNIQFVSALHMIYFVENEGEDSDGNNHKMEKWERSVFLKIAKRLNDDSSSPIRVFRNAQCSMDDALMETLQADVRLVIVGAILMVIFVIFSLGRPKPLSSKITVGFAGIACVCASIMATFGIMSLVGVVFSPVNNALPFVLIGIATDTMFTIVGAMQRGMEFTDPLWCVQEAFRDMGPTVMGMSLANAGTYFTGAFSQLPAIRDFSLYAGVAMLINHIVFWVIFSSAARLDANREKAGKFDICCCFPRRTQQQAILREEKEEGISLVYPTQFIESQESLVRMATHVRRHKKLYIACWVVLGVGTLVGISILCVRIPRLKREFSMQRLAPKHHYISSYLTKSDEYFCEIGPYLYIYWKDFDYSLKQNYFNMMSLQTRMLNMRYAGRFKGNVLSWMTSWDGFFAFNKMQHPNETDAEGFPLQQSDYYPFMNDWLDVFFGMRWRHDLVFRDNSRNPSVTNPIVAARAMMFLKYETDAHDQIESMNDAYDTVDDWKSVTGLPATAYSIVFVFYDQLDVIIHEFLTSFISGIVVILLVSILMGLRISAIIMITIGAAAVECIALGMLQVLNLHLDCLTLCAMLLSFGVCIDCLSLIVHTYSFVQGPRISRLVLTLVKAGPAVFLSSCSTVLGVVPLHFANSVIFTTFFKVFVVVVLTSLAVGVFLVLPLVALMTSAIPDSSSSLSSTISSSVSSSMGYEEEETISEEKDDSGDGVRNRPFFYGGIQ